MNQNFKRVGEAHKKKMKIINKQAASKVEKKMNDAMAIAADMFKIV